MSATTPGVIADAYPFRPGRELTAAGSAARTVALVIGGAAFVGLAAQISIPLPFTPVPVTGQTFAVLLTGAALGTSRAIWSMALYLLAGVAGIPWFAGHSTAMHDGALVASFGYIIGFVAAAGLAGWLAQRGWTRTPLRTAGVFVLGNLVIYSFGLAWLKFTLSVSWATAVSLGLTPFLLGDALKIAAAAALFPAAWRLVQRVRSE
jgi:biotin transport system substrate-specific component